jgi:AraC-like DNA-binding protein
MSPPVHEIDRDTLWHIRGCGREVHGRGRRYWWENRTKTPGGAVVQFTRSGSIAYYDAEGTRAVGPGTLMLFVYGDSTAYGHRLPLREPYACSWVSVFGAGVVPHIRSLIQSHGPVLRVGATHALVEGLDHLIDRADPRRGVEPTDLAQDIHHFVMGLFGLGDTASGQAWTAVERAIQSILRRPHQPQSLKQIAAAYGVSREHLSRCFRQSVGRSASAVLAEAKLTRARSLLQETPLPIAEVARQAGFASPQVMARHVRRATGLAPAAYRAAGQIA